MDSFVYESMKWCILSYPTALRHQWLFIKLPMARAPCSPAFLNGKVQTTLPWLWQRPGTDPGDG